MKNRFFLVVATVAAVALMTSCGKVPQANIDAAVAAIDSAKTMQADIYLPGDFAALNDSLTVINQAVEAQKSKLFKNFKDVKVKADALTVVAGELAGKAVVKKDEVKAEAETLMTQAKALLEENKTLIAKAPKGKEGKAVLDEIKGEVTVIETSLTEAQAIFDAGTNYMQVLDKVKAANEALTAINTELKDAIAKVRR
jgi:Icc-related predicted phosphoesterase